MGERSRDNAVSDCKYYIFASLRLRQHPYLFSTDPHPGKFARVVQTRMRASVPVDNLPLNQQFGTIQHRPYVDSKGANAVCPHLSQHLLIHI